MKTATFNFNEIIDLTDFYKQFQEEFKLDTRLATNLDGLWDALTGMIELPVTIKFENMALEQLVKFEDLIILLEEAEEETEYEIKFSYFIVKQV